MQLSTLPWYNCLAWALAQVLGEPLPYRYLKYILDSRLPIAVSFEQKASEFGISVSQINSIEDLRNYNLGFLVYGFFLEEVREQNYLSYENSGFHIVLYNKGKLYHQNGCGALPTLTSVRELQRMGYESPLYFAVKEWD